MSDPRFNEPEWDYTCDEQGYPWDGENSDDLGNYDEDE